MLSMYINIAVVQWANLIVFKYTIERYSSYIPNCAELSANISLKYCQLLTHLSPGLTALLTSFLSSLLRIQGQYILVHSFTIFTSLKLISITMWCVFVESSTKCRVPTSLDITNGVW